MLDSRIIRVTCVSICRMRVYVLRIYVGARASASAGAGAKVGAGLLFRPSIGIPIDRPANYTDRASLPGLLLSVILDRSSD